MLCSLVMHKMLGFHPKMSNLWRKAKCWLIYLWFVEDLNIDLWDGLGGKEPCSSSCSTPCRGQGHLPLEIPNSSSLASNPSRDGDPLADGSHLIKAFRFLL